MAIRKRSAAAMIAGKRTFIQGLLGVAVYLAVGVFGVSLWLVLAAGAALGLVFGKVFCRWICPMGFIMELITGLGGSDGKFRQLYQYHKLGCPIAWVSGWLNRFSFFRVRVDETSCASCGRCDSACYIASLEPERFSLYRRDKERPGEAFACSKCLACVAACPNGSLSFRVAPVGATSSRER